MGAPTPFECMIRMIDGMEGIKETMFSHCHFGLIETTVFFCNWLKNEQHEKLVTAESELKLIQCKMHEFLGITVLKLTVFLCSFLQGHDCARLACTASLWLQASGCDSLWKGFITKEYPLDADTRSSSNISYKYEPLFVTFS